MGGPASPSNGWATNACIAITALVAAGLGWLILLPKALYAQHPMSLDEIHLWSLQGGGGASLPRSYRGVWYLDGNQEPHECTPAERLNRTLCGPGGFKRSGLLLFDSTHCIYESEEALVCPMALAGGFATKKLAGDMSTMRVKYDIVKDAEFAPRSSAGGRSSPKLEGAMHMSFLGVPACDLAALVGLGKTYCPYRVTLYDTKGDGKSLLRLTWWGVDSPYTPQPKKAAAKPWTYKMRRVVDADGRVDKGVLKQMKRTYGPTAYVTRSRFEGLARALSLSVGSV